MVVKHKEHTVQNHTIHYVCMQVEEEVEVVLGDEDEGGVVVSGDVVFCKIFLLPECLHEASMHRFSL